MAQRLGIGVYAEDQYVNDPSAKTTVTYDDWLKIVDYYTKTAPKAIKPAKAPITPLKDWGVFTLVKPTRDTVPIATTTMVAFDTIGHRIFTSDMMNNSLYQWSDQLKLQATSKFSSPAVNVQFTKDNKGDEQAAFTFIGTMRAIDIANGYIADADLSKPGKMQLDTIADKLPRPIQSLRADFNKDGLTDRLVCGFGHNSGGLYWYKQLPGKKFEKIVISSMPGAEQAVIGDFNNDGWPDIACLFAQADEGVWMFLNDHKGGFASRNLIRFSPVYGSSSFQLVDFNHDGKLDILYTSGDNSDYSKILKPFHGVYIFLNQGNFTYKQAYFYPVNGATKAIAADFNGDGRLDIALIAFFSDLKNNPGEGFTYFEQDSPMHFIPHNPPIFNYGRWICMDVKDYDSDGKPDIILGNFSFGFINEENFKATWNTRNPFIILKNTAGGKLK
ncbi:MAG: VCBS repeat-containing protein, partial [Mucilaginibacter sp.]|uniref:FG-GAP repeat domain-containing protein n=1 Tax=Mucilaginibacter sp. TaxID=1882438 RepID=UPI0031A68EB7